MFEVLFSPPPRASSAWKRFALSLPLLLSLTSLALFGVHHVKTRSPAAHRHVVSGHGVAYRQAFEVRCATEAP